MQQLENDSMRANLCEDYRDMDMNKHVKYRVYTKNPGSLFKSALLFN